MMVSSDLTASTDFALSGQTRRDSSFRDSQIAHPRLSSTVNWGRDYGSKTSENPRSTKSTRTTGPVSSSANSQPESSFLRTAAGLHPISVAYRTRIAFSLATLHQRQADNERLGWNDHSVGGKYRSPISLPSRHIEGVERCCRRIYPTVNAWTLFHCFLMGSFVLARPRLGSSQGSADPRGFCSSR